MYRKRHHKRWSPILIVGVILCLLVVGVFRVLPLSRSLKYNFGSIVPVVTTLPAEMVGIINHARSYILNQYSTLENGDSVKVGGEDLPEDKILFRIGVLSDSHGNDLNILTALNEMRNSSVDLVIHLGDFTYAGEEDSFRLAHEVLGKSGLKYLVVPGDHDFNWVPERSRRNYELEFGQSYDQTYFPSDQIGVLLFDNSVESINNVEKDIWLNQALLEAKDRSLVLFFSSHPLVNSYFPSKSDGHGAEVLARVTEFGIEYVIAGNTHIFSLDDDSRDGVSLITVGAVGSYKSPLPQWLLIEVREGFEVKFVPRPIVHL